MDDPLDEVQGDCSGHNEDERQHEDVLQSASTERLRELLIERTVHATGMSPHEFQVDTALALHQRKDVVLVAGTGFGKTLSFVMPCFLSKWNTVVILSPLNALQEEQVSLLLIRQSD